MEGKWSGVMDTYDSSARTSIARGPIRFKADGEGQSYSNFDYYNQNIIISVYAKEYCKCALTSVLPADIL